MAMTRNLTSDRKRSVLTVSSYAWLTGLFFMSGLFWLDYLGILRLSTQNALALSVVVLALSAVIYQTYLFRKGDVE